MRDPTVPIVTLYQDWGWDPVFENLTFFFDMLRLSHSSQMIDAFQGPKWCLNETEVETKFWKLEKLFWHAETESQLSIDLGATLPKVNIYQGWGWDPVFENLKYFFDMLRLNLSSQLIWFKIFQSESAPRMKFKPSFWKLNILHWHTRTDSPLLTDLAWHFPKWICTKKVCWGWDPVFENLR